MMSYLFWEGVDINTGDQIFLWDTPLRMQIKSPLDCWEIPAERILHMAVATSSNLGTAAVVYADTGDPEKILVVEAAPRDSIRRRTYHHALGTAQQHVDAAIELERAWSEEASRADDLSAEADRLLELLRKRTNPHAR